MYTAIKRDFSYREDWMFFLIENTLSDVNFQSKKISKLMKF